MKNLTDYGAISKLFYKLKSFKEVVVIPARIRWTAITKTINPQSTTTIAQFQKEASKPLCVPFYKFDSPALFYNWAVSTDQEVGGESIATLSYNEVEKYDDNIISRLSLAELKGKLIEERNDLLQQRMYVGLNCMALARINMRGYNGIRMTIKTDGNLYKMLFSCNSDFDLYHDAYAFTIDRTCDWQTVEIPFARFLVEKLKGQDKSIHSNLYIFQKFMEYFIDKFILKGFALVVESEKETNFCFQIKSIEMVYREDFSKVIELYRRPFFFLMQDNYFNCEKLDLGDQVLNIRKEVHSQQERKVTVNECINPKEVTQFTSFKDKIRSNQQQQQQQQQQSTKSQ